MNPKQQLVPCLSRRRFLVGSAVVLGGAVMPVRSRAGETKPGTEQIVLKAAEPWAPHPKAAPITQQRGDAFAVLANGTRTCSGGWQWLYDGLSPGKTYEISTEVSFRDLDVPRDVLKCIAIWGAPSPNQSSPDAIWDFMLPESERSDHLRFARCAVVPEDGSQLTVRCTLRWTASGETLWQAPRVAVAGTQLVKRPPVRVCVVTGTAHSRQRQFKSLRDNIEFYGNLCEAACKQHHPQLVVLPEVALQWGVPGSALDLAVPAPGPETGAFAALARKYQVRIALGMFERDGDAVHNSVVLINPTGAIDGRYRKVHLAAGGEDVSGILPGDSFPVFDTEMGRIGCNICMDSSAAESSRMVGLNGADFLLLPIMGDHRADRWNRGTPIHNEDRWRAIMRTHAMDNQLCMVVARNGAQGSCIVDRKGDLLAVNEGDQPFIYTDVTLDDGYRIWQGGCFRDVNWLQRRPQLYKAFTDPTNLGGLK